MAETGSNDFNNTSPRILQEMALMPPPSMSNEHDITNASVISMKQYEEQMKSLKKENFNLRFRVYLLEEKLGTGAHPSVKGLLEHNVRLQVEVEELRRQLSDKQELLAAAVEAIDVIEQKGCISTDSMEGPSTPVPGGKHAQKKLNLEHSGIDTCQETESAGEPLISCTEDEVNEISRLKKEHHRALQMIKECIKKIQKQEKELKKLRMSKDANSQVSDSHLDKYEEIVKCKDEHIKDLENKVMELQKNANVDNGNNSGNLQELLTRRLQGMAFFLDKLLSHKCVLGEDKKKLAESILEQSLALPVGLKLDETMAPEEFTMDESNIDMSQSLRMEDLTIMFGHHMSCGTGGGGCGGSDHRQRRLRKVELADLSESECWSEPDRNVSLARIGLLDAPPLAATAASERCRGRRARLAQAPREDGPVSDPTQLERIDALKEQLDCMLAEKYELEAKLEHAHKQIDELIAERNSLNEVVALERMNVIDANKIAAKSEQTVILAESRIKELECSLSRASETSERLRAEKLELEASFSEREVALRRAADEAAVAASQAALERARHHHERLQAERELDELRAAAAAAAAAVPQRLAHEPHSEEDRPTSPDQGIDSDRLSSLEQLGVNLSPRSLYEENLSLRQKLARSKATLAETLAQLNESNMRKRSVQRAICREIHKTHSVLRKARDQFEDPNSH